MYKLLYKAPRCYTVSSCTGQLWPLSSKIMRACSNSGRRRALKIMSSKASLFKKNLAKSHLHKTKTTTLPPPKTTKNRKKGRRKPVQLLLALTSLTLKSCLHKADWLEKRKFHVPERSKTKNKGRKILRVSMECLEAEHLRTESYSIATKQSGTTI